jgi:hypothetical protein
VEINVARKGSKRLQKTWKERLSTGTETDQALLGSEADLSNFTNQQPGLPDSQNELSQPHHASTVSIGRKVGKV